MPGRALPSGETAETGPTLMPNREAPHGPADPPSRPPGSCPASPAGLLDSIPSRDLVAHSLPTPRPFLLLGASRVPANSVIPVHSHPMAALHGCFQGPLTLVTAAGEQALDAGVFYLVGPGVRHGWRNDGPRDAVSVAFWIDTNSPGAWPAESGVRDCCRELSRSVRGLHRFTVGEDAELYAPFWGLLDHLTAERPRKVAGTTGLLLSLLARIAHRASLQTVDVL